MIPINAILATFGFELRQFLTPQRLALSATLALFPPIMLTLFFLGFQVAGEHFGYALFISVLFTSIICLLSLFLWATPNVYSELEGKSWIFAASRPRGRTSILLGKYLAAVAFSFLICFLAITGCILVTLRFSSALRDPMAMWLKMNLLYLLGCTVYGAIYSLIGTLHYKRAMVIAAVYTLLSDIIFANAPAVISRLSMRFHLQFIGLEWFGEFMPISGEELRAHYLLSNDTTIWFHLISIGAVTLLCLGAGIWVITHREYATSDET